MDPLIITVAGIGAELTREQQPGLPITPEEVGADAADCAAVGASIYHLHVRDSRGRPTMDVATFRAARAAIEEATDLIVQFTTGGSVSDDEDARTAPLQLRPEMASLTTGTVNFGDEVFFNPGPLVERLHSRMVSLGVLPEFEIFDAGMINNALRVYEVNEATHHPHFDFVLGVPGAMPAWDDSIDFLAGHLPAGATWSATGIGKAHLPVLNRTLELGGHVRTGLEDVRYLAPGRIAQSNRELIERVRDAARSTGRELASPRVAREVLGLG